MLDLIDTNFHANGFLFPREPLAEGLAAYAAERRYDPHPRGAPEARASIAAWYAAAGVSVGAESLLITASASESYHLLFNTLASPGDNVLLPRPGYPLFDYLASFSHLESRSYRLDPERALGDRPGIGGSGDRRADALCRADIAQQPHRPGGLGGGDHGPAGDLPPARRAPDLRRSVQRVPVWQATRSPRPAALASDVVVFTLNGVSKMFACPDLKLGWIAVTGPPRSPARPSRPSRPSTTST